jgi:hypothetical protein
VLTVRNMCIPKALNDVLNCNVVSSGVPSACSPEIILSHIPGLCGMCD